LNLIDQHTRAIEELTARIEVMMEPFRGARDLMVTIPGISTGVADVIIAETGADMSRFPSAGHLASWAGTCPGNDESAGKIKSTQTRPGNPYLKGALGVAAISAARSHDTYLAAKFRRIASRRGPVKAVVAVEHALLIAIWHMLTTGAFYTEPGGDFCPDTPTTAAASSLVRPWAICRQNSRSTCRRGGGLPGDRNAGRIARSASRCLRPAIKEHLHHRGVATTS